MANLRRLQTFIEMYDRQDDIVVYNDGNKVAVRVNTGEIYFCKTLIDASHCVNCLIFDLPIQAEKIQDKYE